MVYSLCVTGEEVLEESADGRLDPEDGMAGEGAQIEHSIVEPSVLKDSSHVVGRAFLTQCVVDLEN